MPIIVPSTEDVTCASSRYVRCHLHICIDLILLIFGSFNMLINESHDLLNIPIAPIDRLTDVAQK